MVYLLHFNTPYWHARHYLGYAQKNLENRLLQHQNGTGARLMQVVNDAGITWKVAKVWPQGDRHLERRLKNWHGSGAFCPICKAEKAVTLPLLAQKDGTWL